MVSFRTCAALLLMVTNVHADPLPSKYLPPLPELRLEAIPAGDDVIFGVTKGQPAPIDGQLFSAETALRWANWLQQYKQQSSLLLQTQASLCSNEIEYRARLLELRTSTYKQVSADMLKRIEQLEAKNTALQVQLVRGPRWYEGRTFGIAVGALGALGFTVLSVWAISAASK